MALTVLNLYDARRAEEARALARTQEEQKKTAAAVDPLLFGLGGDAEDAKFRRITSPATLRDLNPLMQERMQQVCYYLAVTAPFGKRIVEIIRNFAIGSGFTVSAEDAKVQAVLDRFWKDPVNKMQRAVKDYCDSKTIFGELCLPVSVNPVDGFVRLGYIDPQEIEAIEYGLLSTGGGGEEISIPVAVRQRQRVGEQQGRRLRIIRRNEDPFSADFGRLEGECFYFSINKAKSASRGISELFSLADWIDVFDQMVFDFADKVRFLNAFIWHYVLKGADEKTVTEFKKKLTESPPKQGGVQVTNDQVAIEAQTPDLKGADMHESARMVKLYGLGGAGLPATFFADPVDANRSTAQEMEGPTGRKLEDRQGEEKAGITEILEFVLDQAVAHGVLPESTNLAFKVGCPDVSAKDLSRGATTLQALGAALALGEDRGYIRAETAARALHKVMKDEMGIEVDSGQEFELAQQEKQERDARQQDQLDPQKNLARALEQMKQAGETVQ